MVAAHADRILDYVRDQEPAIVNLMRRLVEAESPSTDPDAHRKVYSVLASELHALDFHVVPLGGGNHGRHLYARPTRREKQADSQLIIGHYDTVWPLGTLSRRPFSVEGGRVRGPGAFDMKGGLAQMVFALRALREFDLRPALLPLILINSDEEIGSRTSSRWVRALSRRARRAYVLEPALGEHGALKTERKGIGRFTITVHGKAAHAGLDPEGGASAILELSHVIQTLFAMNDVERGISVNVGTVNGGLQPNVIAPNSQAIVDVRVPTNAAGARIEKAIHGITASIPGVRLTIEGRIGRPAMEPTPRNDALYRKARDLAKNLGIDLAHARAGGGSDGNTASQYTATLDGLGPVGDGAHAEHEFLYLDRTLERTALLALLMLAPACGNEDGNGSR